MKNTILIIDSATEACSAALFNLDLKNNESTAAIQPEKAVYEVAPRKQAELILGQVDGIMAEAGLSLQDVDYLGFVRGPGAFTGVRVAASVVQGFAVALDKPVIGLSSLQLMAQMAAEQCQAQAVSAAIDARMDEVYWQNFKANDDGLMLAVDEPCVLPPEHVQHSLANTDVATVGTGWQRYLEIFSAHYTQINPLENTVTYPNVAFAGALAVSEIRHKAFLKVEECTPFYLRNKVVKAPTSNKNKANDRNL